MGSTTAGLVGNDCSGNGTAAIVAALGSLIPACPEIDEHVTTSSQVVSCPQRRRSPVPDEIAIRKAVPDGSNLIRRGSRWLEALETDQAVRELRSDARTHLLDVASAYVRHVHWRTGTTRPGHATIVAETGLAMPTVKRHVRWLREHGWLGTVVPGSTVATRRGKRPDCGNEAAVYCLALPHHSPARSSAARRLAYPQGHQRREPRSDPPTSSSTYSVDDEENPRARKRAGDDTTWERPAPWRSGVLGRLSDRTIRRITKKFTDHGYTALDITHAVDHRPDGSAHWHTTIIRNPAAWVTYRLSLWTTDGTPVESHSQRLARQADAHREHVASLVDVQQRSKFRAFHAKKDAATRTNPHGIPETSRTEALAALRAQLRQPTGPDGRWRDKAAEQAAAFRVKPEARKTDGSLWTA